MVLWDRDIDSHVTILPTTSSAVLPVLLDSPGFNQSIHIGIYLPTSGCEQEWSIALSTLSMVVDDALSLYPGIPIYIRGDANVNPNHPTRPQIFGDFLSRYGFVSKPLSHNTYHHFTGNGASDSQLDVMLSSADHPDKLVSIICKHDNPLVTSSHDAIVTSFTIWPTTHQPSPVPMAPRAPTTRFRVCWDDSGTHQYAAILEEALPPLMEALGDSTNRDKVSSLLNLTNRALNNAARQSFKVIELSKPYKPKKARSDPTIQHLSSQISRCCAALRKTSDLQAKQQLICEHSALSHQ